MIIRINTYADKPIYEQLRDNIILGIASGQLEESESLPSARSLAADLGVNFHTVNKAYDALRAGGYIVMDRRKIAKVAPQKTEGTVLPILVERLTLNAAEAICHGVDERAFAALCVESYTKIKGGSI